jgi:hypothetical protein
LFFDNGQSGNAEILNTKGGKMNGMHADARLVIDPRQRKLTMVP